MIPVSSSDISSVGYENNILCIIFNSGGKYIYHNVPLDVYNSLLSAPSHGKFFHAYIKGRYSYEKLG